MSPFFIKLDGLNDSQLKHLRDVGQVNETGYDVRLLREKHVKYLLTGLGNLSAGYSSLDASRPWIAYWCLHSLDLLDAVDDDLCPRVVSTLKSFQNETGGFGGGPMQLSHGAPTYASCLALLLVAPKCPAAYECIDRPALYRWFLAMKTPTGGFRMHDDGEVDVRGTYTVIAIAALCNLLTPELCENVAEFTVSCQTYEGGEESSTSSTTTSSHHPQPNFLTSISLRIRRRTRKRGTRRLRLLRRGRPADSRQAGHVRCGGPQGLDRKEANVI